MVTGVIRLTATVNFKIIVACICFPLLGVLHNIYEIQKCPNVLFKRKTTIQTRQNAAQLLSGRVVLSDGM